MSERSFDVVLYGASGFTGKQTADYFAEHVGDRLRWAIAGRNRTKLEAIRAGLGDAFRELPIVVADSGDEAAVDSMVAQTRVLVSTAGPFSRYGSSIVAACAKHGTDYVDITGETPWVRRMIDAHGAAAEQSGAKIVPLCGFDSVPSDLGVFAMTDYARRECGESVRAVRALFSVRGGVNGGTLETMMQAQVTGDAKRLQDRHLLRPEGATGDVDSREIQKPHFDSDLDAWAAPFVMSPINTRVVGRSAHLAASFGEAYGDPFSYREGMKTGRGVGGATIAWAAALGTGAAVVLTGSSIGRALMKPLIPSPGEGPSEAAMDGGFFRGSFFATTEGGRRLLGRVEDQGDPGNRVTVRTLCEAALALVDDREQLPGGDARSGFLTPATCFGNVLLDRWRARGASIEVREAG